MPYWSIDPATLLPGQIPALPSRQMELEELCFPNYGVKEGLVKIHTIVCSVDFLIVHCNVECADVMVKIAMSGMCSL